LEVELKSLQYNHHQLLHQWHHQHAQFVHAQQDSSSSLEEQEVQQLVLVLEMLMQQVVEMLLVQE